MDNNHGSPSQYRYPNPNFYPPNPHLPYPAPPPAPAHAPDPYAHFRHPYPFNFWHSFNYPHPPPPRSTLSYSHSSQFDHSYPPPPRSPPSGHHDSGPLDFNRPPVPAPYPYPYPYHYHVPPGTHNPPWPYLSHNVSLQYGPSQYYYRPNEGHSSADDPINAHLRANSLSGPNNTTSSTGGGTSPSGGDSNSKPSHHSPAYPPLDDLISDVRLSDSKPNDLALTPENADKPLKHSISAPKLHPKNNSFSGWGSSYSGRIDSSRFSSSSGSFDGSLHSQSSQIVPTQGKGSLRVLLLHGSLDIWVFEAKNLPNMDMFHKTLGDVFGKLPGSVSNKIEGTMNRKITSDPYVSISVSNAVIGRTFVISNSENPVWMQHFYVPVAHHAAEVHFVVKDSDVVGSQLIGIVAIPVEQIYSGEIVEGTYPILNSNGKPSKQGAVLTLSIQYIPMEHLSIYHQGVGAGPDYIGVPATYFPLRKGGTVTLYQDAHVPDGCLPNVLLDNGTYYVHGRCWVDIFDAIRQARRLIYITGWSVWHKVRLIRETAGSASDYTLGDLLRTKSQEGVRVLLLIWDDPTSRSILGYQTV